MPNPFARVVIERARHSCEYCRLPDRVVVVPFEIEHIVPHQHDGGDDLDNLAYACLPCNRRKGPNIGGFDREQTGFRLVPIFHPRRHRWDSHFVRVGNRIEGRTAIGRVTVRLLQMNSERAMKIRAELPCE